MSRTSTRPRAGVETIAAVRRLLQVDDVWSIDLPDGFAWWAFRTRQEMRALPVAGEPDDARIVVRTPVLSAPTADGPTVAHVLAEMNGVTTGGAFRQAADGTIVHELSAYAAPDTEWVTQTVATCAMVALSQGVQHAASHASALGAAPLESCHPVTGPRPWPDDMLNLDEMLLVPLGREESAFADPGSFRTAIEIVNSGVGFSAGGTGEDGLVCEIGFGADNSSFLTVRPTADPPRSLAPGMPAAAPDPVYGNGLLVWLILPVSLRRAEAEALAARLNAAELEVPDRRFTGAMHFGAWTVWDPDGRATPAYRMFLPNLLGETVSTSNVALHFASRALAASRFLRPDQEPLDGPGIVRLRLRQLPEVFDLPKPN